MDKLFDGKIKQRTYIEAPVEKVYETITSAQEWDKFFTTGIQLEPKLGGVCNFSWKDWEPDFYTLTAPGKVVNIVQPRFFAFKWGEEGKESTVRFELEPFGSGTILTITEDGYSDTPDGHKMILECASGWGETATLLKFYLELGIVYKSPQRPY
ncbi:MAG: SRPBCC family protein [Candidatus Zixiibacteriota bacterium]